MPLELTAPEKASGFYFSDRSPVGSGQVVLRISVVGLSARHYIATRHLDAAAVHITGDEAALLDDFLESLNDLNASIKGREMAEFIDQNFMRRTLRKEGIPDHDNGDRGIGS